MVGQDPAEAVPVPPCREAPADGQPAAGNRLRPIHHGIRHVSRDQIVRRPTLGAHNRTDVPDLDQALQVNFYVDARMDPWSEPVPGVPDELREWTERPVELGAERLFE